MELVLYICSVYLDDLDRHSPAFHLAIQDLVCRAPKFFQKMPTMARRSGTRFHVYSYVLFIALALYCSLRLQLRVDRWW